MSIPFPPDSGAGFDVTWMVELQPGANDEMVLSIAQQDDRALITFDKDFGELVFRRGLAGSRGVILLRPRLRSPEIVSAFIVNVLSPSPSTGPVISPLPRKDHSASSRCDNPLADDQRLPRAELDRLDLLTAGVLTASPPQNQFSVRLADG